MNEIELANHRRQRLADAVDAVSKGDRTAFGRRLGYRDGAFIRQMISGSRAISERTVYKIENLPGMRGWFAKEYSNARVKVGNNVESIEAKALNEIAARYAAIGDAAQRVVDLVLRRDDEPMPVWATRPLISAVDTAIAIAELSTEPQTELPKQARNLPKPARK